MFVIISKKFELGSVKPAILKLAPSGAFLVQFDWVLGCIFLSSLLGRK